MFLSQTFQYQKKIKLSRWFLKFNFNIYLCSLFVKLAFSRSQFFFPRTNKRYFSCWHQNCLFFCTSFSVRHFKFWSFMLCLKRLSIISLYAVSQNLAWHGISLAWCAFRCFVTVKIAKVQVISKLNFSILSNLIQFVVWKYNSETRWGRYCFNSVIFKAELAL